MPPVDKKQLKDALLKTLAEKGEYTTILKHLSDEEKEEKDNQFKELIKPMSAVADILVGNARGAFTEPLNKLFEERADELRGIIDEKLSKDKDDFSSALNEAFSNRNEEFTKEILENLAESQTNLSTTLNKLVSQLVGEKAEEMLFTLGEQARLTEDEIEDIIEQAALSVESQIERIIGEYIDEQKISVSQITDFAENVKKLLPPERQITWNDIANKPNLSQGGTNTNIVRQLIAEALANFNGGGGSGIVETIQAGTGITVDNTDPANPIVSATGGGGSGITRTIASISTPTTAGATASTDYVYFVTNTTLTLPTAVSNINRYTVKCVSGTCIVDGAGAETIDGTATITIQVEDSVDLISNNTEFKVV